MVSAMESLPRVYDAMLDRHLSGSGRMAFISGPRQVGKTTCCCNKANRCLDWDDPDGRADILAGPAHVAERAGLDTPIASKPVFLFDGLHRHVEWKEFVTGFVDAYSDRARAIVTGIHMDSYPLGSDDGQMSRRFVCDMHPYSVAEAITQDLPDPNRVVRQPVPIDDASFDALWNHGGYPEPFLKRNLCFSRDWRLLRQKQLVREDIRNAAQIQHLDQLDSLAHMLTRMSAQQLVYSDLSIQVRVSIDTIRRWIAYLCQFHFGFVLRPWTQSVPRSLRKEPKWFLRDWAAIEDPGSRAETFVACHLLKAVDGWSNLGFGNFGLHYLRDKEKREVDFLVVRDERPWLLVEVRHGDGGLSPALRRFQELLGVPFAMQVVLEAEYVDADCFARKDSPLIVPARTFLSQLL